MMENLPIYIPLAFGGIVIAALFLFYQALKQSVSQKTRDASNAVLIGLIGWLVLQAALTNSYHSNLGALPPRLMLLGILPALLAIFLLFVTPKGRRFIDHLPLVQLTYLNVVRIAIELVLFQLFVYKSVPEAMTFEGRNFDILSGITAPIAAYFARSETRQGRLIMLVWNVVCLGLLVNVVIIALFAAPFPFQRFGLNQPNVAILYFPFSWLPSFLVPLVLFGHLASIRQLLKRRVLY